MEIKLEKGAKKTEGAGFPMGRKCSRRKGVSEGNAAGRGNIDVNRSYAHCMYDICS